MPEGETTIPPLGLGTHGRTGADGLDAILAAIELGYRHLDTAQTYDTEQNVGEAVAQSGLPRGDFFLVTKVSNTNLRRRDFLPSLERSLETLGVEQVDLTLIHWPSYQDAVPLAEYLGELAEARARGLTRLIGVSNFTIGHLERAEAILGSGAIATNQVEFHPYLQQRRLAAWCAGHSIPLTAYLPIAQGRVAGDPVLARIGEAHGMPATTVALAWLLHTGAIAIPASSRREHLAANLKARDLRLSDAELSEIAELDAGMRVIDPSGLSPAWD